MAKSRYKLSDKSITEANISNPSQTNMVPTVDTCLVFCLKANPKQEGAT